MKVLIYVMSAATLLTLFSTIICGLWIKANHVVEASSIKFHATIGILSAVLTVSLIVIVMFALKGKL